MTELQIKLTEFTLRADSLITKIDALIDTLPDKGLKCEYSQKVCLKQAARHLENNFNGLEENDFIK